MNAGLIGLIVAVIGFVTMILKWAYNPKRILEAKIEKLEDRWHSLQSQVNVPLMKHDTNTLTRLNKELLQVIKDLKEARAKLEEIKTGTKIKIMAGLILVLWASGCIHNTHFFNDSETVICDNAKTGVCANFNYDCCVMAAGDWKTIGADNPTIKIIKVQDNTKEGD